MPEIVTFDGGHIGKVTDRTPLCGDHVDLVINDRARLGLGEMVGKRLFNTSCNLTYVLARPAPHGNTLLRNGSVSLEERKKVLGHSPNSNLADITDAHETEDTDARAREALGEIFGSEVAQ
jgi:hypothetical protein